MPFLRDDITFHRFATDVSIDSRRQSEEKIPPGRDKLSQEPNFTPSVWTTNYKSNYSSATNDFHYIPSNDNNSTSRSTTHHNGSTAKLILPADDEKNKQVSQSTLKLLGAVKNGFVIVHSHS